MTTSPSIPDGVSFSELQKLAETASAEEQTTEQSGPTWGDKELTKDQLLQAVEDAFDASMEMCNDPLFHKLIVMRICSNFVSWHTNVGVEHFPDEEQAGVCWLRDAGKFQSMMDIMQSINVGQDDFVTPLA